MNDLCGVEKACICGSLFFDNIFTYDAPPAGEVRFAFSAGTDYHRKVIRCCYCGHFLSKHNMNEKNLYNGGYVDANYKNPEGMETAFQRIINLPTDCSDNTGRVAKVISFAERHFAGYHQEKPDILDVGSGLGVFLYLVKKAGWDCTALDPDERAACHSRERIGIKAIQGDFFAVALEQSFDVISLNKVLEHVEKPVAMLEKAGHHLNEKGFIYVEVPDGEAAMLGGPEREEFYIDHPHIFSAASLAVLAHRAGLKLLEMQRLQEPSSKFTLRGFIVK